jgi:hypothetical protein
MYNDWSLPERPLEPPPEPPMPRCPICGEETDTFYRNKDLDIVGCDECVTTVDAWEEQDGPC